MNSKSYSVDEILRRVAEDSKSALSKGIEISSTFESCWPRFRIEAHSTEPTLVFQKWLETHVPTCLPCQEIVKTVSTTRKASSDMETVVEHSLLIPNSIAFESQLLFAASSGHPWEPDFTQYDKLPYVDYLRLGSCPAHPQGVWLVFIQRTVVLGLIGGEPKSDGINVPQIVVGDERTPFELKKISFADSAFLFPPEFGGDKSIHCFQILAGQGCLVDQPIRFPGLLVSPVLIQSARPEGLTRRDPFVSLIDKGLPQPLFDCLDQMGQTPALIARTSFYLRILKKQKRRLEESDWNWARSMPWLNDNLTPRFPGAHE